MTNAPIPISKYSVMMARQICVGDICIAAYPTAIRKTKSGAPDPGIEAKASGNPTTLIDCCPLIIVPKKKITKKVINDGIGKADRVAGKEWTIPVSSTISLKIITQIVVKIRRFSKAENNIGLSSIHLNLLMKTLATIAIATDI